MASVVSIRPDVSLAPSVAHASPRILERVAAAVGSLGIDEFVAQAESLITELGFERCEVVLGDASPPPGWEKVPLLVGRETIGSLLLYCPDIAGAERRDPFRAEVRWVTSVLALALHHRAAIALERDRIAQELHDFVGQTIIGLGFRLATMMTGEEQAARRSEFADVVRLTDRASSELREAIQGLLCEPIGEGLDGAVGRLCRDFEARTGVVTKFEAMGNPERAAAAKEDAVFRVAVEALRNIERHAAASTVLVQLRCSGGMISLVVEDDGQGPAVGDSFTKPGRFGIRTMQRRIEDAGGDLHVTRTARGGVRVQAVIPGRGTRNGAGTGGGRR